MRTCSMPGVLIGARDMDIKKAEGLLSGNDFSRIQQLDVEEKSPTHTASCI